MVPCLLPGRLCRGCERSLWGRSETLRLGGLCACLLFALPRAVPFSSPRNIKKTGEGRRRPRESSVHNSLSAASAQLHNSFPVMSSCCKQAALGLVGHVQAVTMSALATRLEQEQAYGPPGPSLRALPTLRGELGCPLGTRLEKEASIDGGGTHSTRGGRGACQWARWKPGCYMLQGTGIGWCQPLHGIPT